jgi:uncharacterized membrane protein (DUF106 family)
MGIKELMIQYPKESIVLIAFLVTLVMTLVTKKFTNQSRMKELKDIQKACQIKLKENKDNVQEIEKAQKQMMECSMEMMKHSMKPTLITLIPLLLFFVWVRGIFTPVLSGWFWWYFITAIASSIVLRKLLKVY